MDTTKKVRYAKYLLVDKEHNMIVDTYHYWDMAKSKLNDMSDQWSGRFSIVTIEDEDMYKIEEVVSVTKKVVRI